MTVHTCNTMDAALAYASLGYAVFPCVPNKKTPATKRGFNDASTDKKQIEEWWQRDPLANVAIRTEGLIVVDVDGAENPWLADDSARAAELATAPTSLTPRGGRHYYFRQPNGREWRNTTSKIAEKVDTRANGGYILAPPSVVEGKHYRWAEDRTLCVAADQLPEPPAWLAALLNSQSRAVETQPLEVATPADAIPEGMRNAELTRMAGGMRRVGMSEEAILAGIEVVNSRRCSPPLPRDELERVAASIARYTIGGSAAAFNDGRWQKEIAAQTIEPLSVRQIVSRYPTLRDPVIHGLLRRGETMNVISVPKLGKSWLVTDLALAIASGGKWLDAFQTERGDVLILDNELHGETSANRIPLVAKERGIALEDFADRLFILNLRGHLRDMFAMQSFFESIEPGRFKVIILDAFYRFMPRDMDENDNGTMAGLYNHLDLYADRLDCCFVLIHHTTKGSQSGKSVTDVGAGAGSQSRATDAHLILRPHQVEDAVVLDAAVRSWPPVQPLCLRWAYPVWNLAGELDAADLRGGRAARRSEKIRPNDLKEPAWTVERVVEEFISAEPISKAEIKEATKGNPGLSWRGVENMLKVAESRGWIRCERIGRGGQMHFSRASQENPSP